MPAATSSTAKPNATTLGFEPLSLPRMPQWSATRSGIRVQTKAGTRMNNDQRSQRHPASEEHQRRAPPSAAHSSLLTNSRISERLRP